MNYRVFSEYVKKHITEYLQEGTYLEIQVETIEKNNGVYLETLFIKKEGKNIYPCIYLQDYYKQLQEGIELSYIMQEIADVSQKQQIPENVEEKIDVDYEQCKNHLFFQLVNAGLNSELWESTPYEPWQDLALTVRWLVTQEEEGITSVLVTNRELEKWGVTWEEVCQEAKKNTPILFPVQITPMQEFLDSGCEYKKNDVSLYILTNELGINGATCICYKNVVSEFARKLQCNLFLLPSSIHEILILPDKGIYKKEQLIEMVWDANHTAVIPSELLSYQIYYCDYETGKIETITK